MNDLKLKVGRNFTYREKEGSVRALKHAGRGKQLRCGMNRSTDSKRRTQMW